MRSKKYLGSVVGIYYSLLGVQFSTRNALLGIYGQNVLLLYLNEFTHPLVDSS